MKIKLMNIGRVYRNDDYKIPPKIIKIKIDNLSLLNKPLWATDAGIIDYNNSKYLFYMILREVK